MNSVAKKGFLASVLLGAFLLPGLVMASPIVRSGDAVSVEADQVLEGDFYGLGSQITISGEAEHDVYVVGGSVTINAPVHEDLVIVGGTVQVHAPVGDDVRIFGGEVTLAEEVKGDVLVFGGTLNILSTTRVLGDVLFFVGSADLGGQIEGSVIGAADDVRIDAGIQGDVSVTAERSLTLGDRTEILGSLEYKSRGEIARAQGAVVVGDIHKKILSEDEDGETLGLLLPLLILLFAALSAYLLFKGSVQRLVGATMESYGTQGLVGLGVLLGLPFVSILLTASVLGSVVGIALLFAYLLLLIASFVAAGIILGTALFSLLKRPIEATLLSVAAGVAVFSVLHLIPFVGPLLMVAVFVVALGGISAQIYRIFR